jgi:DnaJ like chaperone protein
LVAKGLPAEMMKLAKEKTQDIQTAYDKVRQARKA